MFINPKTGERQIAIIPINPGAGRVYSSRDEQLSTLDSRKTQPYHELRQLDVYCYRQPHWATPYGYQPAFFGFFNSCSVTFVQIGYETVCRDTKTGSIYSRTVEIVDGYHAYTQVTKIGTLSANQGCQVINPNNETVYVK